MPSSEEKSPALEVSSIPTSEAKSQQRGRTMATIEDDDERLLNQIGYTQVSSLKSSVRIVSSLTN